MAITKVQQTQISGSLNSAVSDSYQAGQDLAIGEHRTLVDDLNALRSQLNRVIGEGAWSKKLAGEQDLADIYGAFHASGTAAAFMGTVSTADKLTVSAGGLDVTGAATLQNSLDVKGASDLEGAVHAYSTLAVDGKATVASFESLGNAKVDGLFEAVQNAVFDASMQVIGSASIGLTLDVTGKATVGSFESLGAAKVDGALTVDGLSTLKGDLGVSGASVLSGSLEVKGAAMMDSTLDVTGDITGDSKIFISGDSAKKGDLYIVGPNGEIYAQDNLVFAGGQLSVTGAVAVTGGASIGGSLSAGASTLDSLSVTNAASVGGTLNVTGAATLSSTLSAGASTLDSLTVTNAASVGGTLDVTGAATFANGITVNAGGMEIMGDKLEITGTLGVTGAASLGSSLSVAGASSLSGAVTMGDALTVAGAATFNGAADFNAAVTAQSIAIDGDMATRLYIVDGDGTIKDEAKLTFDGSKLSVTGALDVSGAAEIHGAALLDSTLEVVGAATLDSTLSVAQAATMSDTLHVIGAASFDSSMTVQGAAILESTLEVDGNAHFLKDVQIDGNLNVKGATTYIDTTNLKVSDAIIHLNVTSGSFSQARGLMFHGDQSYDDLAFGAKANSGDFVFAKGVSDANVDGSNADIFVDAKLSAAWMQSVKLGGKEGLMSGSLAAGAGEIVLSSVGVISASAAGDMKLSANGQEFSLAAAGERALFVSEFGDVSIIGALLQAAAGSHMLQDSFQPGVKAAGAAIDFSSVGSLRPEAYASEAAKKNAMDVYLNGVRLSYNGDYSISNGGVLSLMMDTVVDDVIYVVIHNAAA